MDLWFSELHTPYVKFSIQIDKQLHSEQTEFQRIDIFESKEFGRMMVLDGYVMLTEKDEFIYHEMIVHVPMALHPLWSALVYSKSRFCTSSAYSPPSAA